MMLAIGALRLLHRDVQEWLAHLIDALRIDPDNHYVAALFAKAGLVKDRKLAQVSGLTFLYAALFLTEGIGLWFEKRWAEWLTVIVTGSFIPIEIYEVWKHCGPVRLIVLGLNLAVVIYLAAVLRRKPASRLASVAE